MNKKAIVKELKKKDWKNIQSPLGSKGKRKFAQMLKTIGKTEQGKFKSYYDEGNVLRVCTCGKCSKPTPPIPEEWAKLRKKARHIAKQLMGKDQYAKQIKSFPNYPSDWEEVFALLFDVRKLSKGEQGLFTELQDFIRKLLTQKEQEVVERIRKKVEGMRLEPNPSAEGCDISGMQDYNQAIDDFLTLLERINI